VIRDVVLHLLSEQPLLADLEHLPTALDNAIICTNLRLLNGSRPIFVDDSASTFVFPMPFVRFLEVPPKALAGFDRMGRPDPDRVALPAPAESQVVPVAEADPEIDEDFLRRVRDV
jgi:hypothetical protein